MMWTDKELSRIAATWWIMFALLAGLPDPRTACAAADQASEPPVRQEAGKAQTEVSQYGITWRFAAPARVGRFITGDWWIVGPVSITQVTPAPAAARNGSVVDPPAGKRQGDDDRLTGYDASLRSKLPLGLRPGQSLVSTASVASDQAQVNLPRDASATASSARSISSASACPQ